MPAFLERRGALRTLKWLVAGWCATFGFYGIMWEISSDGTNATWQRITVGIVTVSAFYAALRWPIAQWPSEARSVLFVVWAEAALALTVLSAADRNTSALAGAGLFILVGIYVTLLHSYRVLVLHLVWTIATILVAFSFAIADPQTDLPMLSSRLMILFGLITVIPWSMHFGVQFLKEDAQGSDRDPLTELLNRRGLAAKSAALLSTRSPESSIFATVVIDLDGFKTLNDKRGHGAGDHALCMVAARLASTIPAPGVVARLGGDEFAAIVCAPTQSEIEAITAAIHDAVHCSTDANTITASTGAWIFGADIPSEADVGVVFSNELHCADLAMYEAKRSGGNKLVRRTAVPSDQGGMARRDRQVMPIGRWRVNGGTRRKARRAETA